MKSLNIPSKMFTWKGFATWDVLMDTAEEAEKLWKGDLHTKFLHLQPDYLGKRKTVVTVHNVPLDIFPDHLGAF